MESRLMGTAIGSMPYDDPEHAVKVSLDSLDCPIWPQLGAFGLKEQMEIQYSEGMPCVVIDEEKGRMYFDTSQDYTDAFAEFYESYMMAMDRTTAMATALQWRYRKNIRMAYTLWNASWKSAAAKNCLG